MLLFGNGGQGIGSIWRITCFCCKSRGTEWTGVSSDASY